MDAKELRHRHERRRERQYLRNVVWQMQSMWFVLQARRRILWVFDSTTWKEDWRTWGDLLQDVRKAF